jgi:hypothetical protein
MSPSRQPPRVERAMDQPIQRPLQLVLALRSPPWASKRSSGSRWVRAICTAELSKPNIGWLILDTRTGCDRSNCRTWSASPASTAALNSSTGDLSPTRSFASSAASQQSRIPAQSRAEHRSGQNLKIFRSRGFQVQRGRARRLQPCRASNRVQASLRTFSAYPDSGWGKRLNEALGVAPRRFAGHPTPLSQSPASTRRAERGSSSIVKNLLQVGGSFPWTGRGLAAPR